MVQLHQSPLLIPQELWRGEVKQLSWSPRAFLLKGFLSEQECDYLIGKVCDSTVPRPHSTALGCSSLC